MIAEKILRKYGARETTFHKDEMLFMEDEKALYYWQIVSGKVKMANFSPDGQEFTQGIFQDGESFGEPPLFADFNYPSNAVAMEDSSLLKLPREKLVELLKENFDIHWMITATLCKRLQYKAMIMREMSSHPPEHRILTLIDYLKHEKSEEHEGERYYEVTLTRQQIADMTGLRVETVIRSIKALEEKGKVKIVSRKVYRKQ
jgi:CRP-like cAMP-binding protein